MTIPSLIKQYNYWSSKLQKTLINHKFHQYSSHKKEHLLHKVYQYSTQLKKLGLTASLGLSLGLATPANSQISYNTSPNYSPVTVSDSIKGGAVVFVDLDNDGDLDIVSNDINYVYSPYTYTDTIIKNYYYENTGTQYISNYVKRQPLFNSSHISSPTFVDIDGDGDLDCFAGKFNPYYITGDAMTYFENTGTPTNPIFTERTGTANPLDSINIHNTNEPNYSMAFTDIDNDGDQDCFYLAKDSATVYSFSFYENIGTDTTPLFSKNDTTNPLANIVINRTYWNTLCLLGSPQFYDINNDGDQDVLIKEKYYENIGTSLSANFIRRTGFINPFKYVEYDLLAIAVPSLFCGPYDCTWYPDIFGSKLGKINTYDYTFIQSPSYAGILKAKQQQIHSTISPNPSTGIFEIEMPLSGILTVSSLLGEVLLTKTIEQQQQFQLTKLPNGVYFLQIETNDGFLSQKIIIQH